VGEIADEFDVDDPIVEPLPGGGIRVHGRTPLDQVNDLLRARLPEGDWDTIGGLVYDRLGHVPVEGESVRLAGWRLTAQRIQGRRIGRVRITPDAGRADAAEAAGSRNASVRPAESGDDAPVRAARPGDDAGPTATPGVGSPADAGDDTATGGTADAGGAGGKSGTLRT
jgi:hypothetical protein